MNVLKFPLKLFFIFYFLLIPFSALLAEGPPSVIYTPSRDAGLFCHFFEVLSLLNSYDEKKVSSITIDFGTTGFYYDPSYGPNWWGYYFEPTSWGIIKPEHLITINERCGQYTNMLKLAYLTPKEKVNRLIQKYIRIKPHIQEKIDHFVENHFEGYMIGVHYRGTDKSCEAPRILYESVVDLLLLEIEKRKLSDYKIFIATDEQPFFDYMISIFNEKICYYSEIQRSTNEQPLHMNISSNPYEVGEGAIIDCILLSKTNLLMRTSSNLSKSSTFFKPNLDEIELSKNYVERGLKGKK